ncbi:MAG: Trm112 family protein [Gammaproteobacteria bacterium]
MSFDRQLLDIICCPATHSPLRLMPADMLEQLNARIESGEIRQRDDQIVTETLEQALVTEDDRLAYPIRDDIPLLLEDCAIVLAQADAL